MGPSAIALHRQHKADRIVAEVNNGGAMVEATIRMVDANVSYSAVRATRGKVIRAEPVAALYEQTRIHHVGAFPTPQLTQFVQEAPEGPDRLHEIKFDGYRMHARLDRGAVRLLTRTGLDWTRKQVEPDSILGS
jgi:phage terminase large subunit-like protein